MGCWGRGLAEEAWLGLLGGGAWVVGGVAWLWGRGLGWGRGLDMGADISGGGVARVVRGRSLADGSWALAALPHWGRGFETLWARLTLGCGAPLCLHI